MTYFKITYLLSGKYKSTYKARILGWDNMKIKIIDIDGKEYVLKEQYLLSIKKLLSNEEKEEKEETIEQQELF